MKRETVSITDRDHLKRVVFSYTAMIMCGILITSAAVMIGEFINRNYPLTQTHIKLFEYLGYICWCATLGMVGWESQTQRNVYAEKLNQRFSTIFSLIGVFAFVLARELIPVG